VHKTQWTNRGSLWAQTINIDKENDTKLQNLKKNYTITPTLWLTVLRHSPAKKHLIQSFRTFCTQTILYRVPTLSLEKFPEFSRTKVLFQDFPGPGIFKKKIQDFPGGVGTLFICTNTCKHHQLACRWNQSWYRFCWPKRTLDVKKLSLFSMSGVSRLEKYRLDVFTGSICLIPALQ